jgi:hypothetical protein
MPGVRQRPRVQRPVLFLVRAPALSEPDLLAEERCPSCGAWLAEDQQWCLECGAARTVIPPPPDWRIGLAIVAAVIALVVIVAVIAWP